MRFSIQKTIIVVLVIGISVLIGLFIYFERNQNFKNLDTNQMYNHLTEELKYAVAKAQEAGVYHCCISPPCTMCYMEGNKWNEGKPGTCQCDKFIAQGEKPCPQCEKGLFQDTGTSCIITGSCESSD